MIETLLTLLIAFAVISLIIYALNYFPIVQPFKNILIGVTILLAAFWLAQHFGVLNA